MRRIPIDLLALIVIALLGLLVHRPFVRQDFALCDHTLLFHYGTRLLDGHGLYRDGPLPAAVDAGFQSLLGSVYVASFYAGLLVKTLRILVVWMLVRRVTNAWTAAPLAVFCLLDPAFGDPHHTPAAYTQLFITASALFVVLAQRASSRWIYLALGGACAGMVTLAQPHLLPVIAVLLLGAAAVLARRDGATGLSALAGGFVVVSGIAIAALVATGIAGAAIVDPWQRHAVHGFVALADALSGGVLVDPNLSWWDGALRAFVPAGAIVALVWYLARQDRRISLGLIAVLIPAAWLLAGLASRYTALGMNLPRLGLLLVAVLAAASPARIRDWFGIEPLTALVVSLLPVISDGVTGLATRGPGPGDVPSLVVAVLVLAFLSSHLGSRPKRVLASVLGVVALAHFVTAIGSRTIFFESPATRSYEGRRYSSEHPRLRGLRLTPPRAKVLDLLTSTVPATSSCFVIGHWPALYTILGCTNPTSIDSTFPAYVTDEELDRARTILLASPPEFLITYRDPATDAWLRSLAARYQHVASAASVLEPSQVEQAQQACDALAAIHIYRLVR